MVKAKRMKKVIETLNNSGNDNIDVQRRRFQRRSTDTCVISVSGVPYPVKDWSLSGVLFEADTRLFNDGDTLPMTLKFRLGDAIADVDVTGNVIRKNARFVATQFEPLSNKAQQTLHQVIDQSASSDESQSVQG